MQGGQGITSGVSDLYEGVGSTFEYKYKKDFSKKAFWQGAHEALKTAQTDYGALYRRFDEEALKVSTEINQIWDEARVQSGSVQTVAASGGVSGNAAAALGANTQRSALLMEGVARRNLLIEERQTNADLEAARQRARAKILQSMPGPITKPEYGKLLTGGASTGLGIAALI